jgi:hypothetical protein
MGTLVLLALSSMINPLGFIRMQIGLYPANIIFMVIYM